MYLVSSNELRGTGDVERAQVIQWLSYADNEILPPASVWTFPYLGILDYNKQVTFCNFISFRFRISCIS